MGENQAGYFATAFSGYLFKHDFRESRKKCVSLPTVESSLKCKQQIELFLQKNQAGRYGHV